MVQPMVSAGTVIRVAGRHQTVRNRHDTIPEGAALVTGFKRFAYTSFVTMIRAYARVFLDMRVFGRMHIPPGPKIYAANHITSSDLYWMLAVCPEPIHVLIGPGYSSSLAARLFDYFEQINVMPAHRGQAVGKAVARLQRGGSVYVAPEGDIQTNQQLNRFYPGVARIYRRCPVPIVPIALCTRPQDMKAYPKLDINVEGRIYRGVFVFRGTYVVNIGKPFRPRIRTGLDEREDNERITVEIKQRIAALLHTARTHAR